MAAGVLTDDPAAGIEPLVRQGGSQHDLAGLSDRELLAEEVLTFRTRAWLSFAPPPCRMPLGPSQASPKMIPKDWPPLGFDIT
jgi:hypothetical protein